MQQLAVTRPQPHQARFSPTPCVPECVMGHLETNAAAVAASSGSQATAGTWMGRAVAAVMWHNAAACVLQTDCQAQEQQPSPSPTWWRARCSLVALNASRRRESDGSTSAGAGTNAAEAQGSSTEVSRGAADAMHAACLSRGGWLRSAPEPCDCSSLVRAAAAGPSAPGLGTAAAVVAGAGPVGRSTCCFQATVGPMRLPARDTSTSSSV